MISWKVIICFYGILGEDSRRTGLVEKGESLLLIGVHT